MPSEFQILSLSGGGARGLYTAQVLAELEKRFRTRIAQHTDIICGTSIGGILALALAAHIPAQKILETFDYHRSSIFPSVPAWKNQNLIGGVTFNDVQQIKRSQYSSTPLKNVVAELFGDRRIRDLESCVLIPAINYTVGRLRAIKTPHDAKFYQDGEKTLVDVALATSAAPTYFPLHQIETDRYVDGGLVANNPILMGVVEAKRVFGMSLDNINGLCIGNMGQGLAVDHETPLELGYKGWGFGQDIINLSLSTGEQHAFDMAQMLLNGRLTKIDSEATERQAQLLALDNGSDAAAEILKGHAINMTGGRVNDQDIQDFFRHQASYFPAKLPQELNDAKV